jgi:pilus assembly protein CpaB
MKFSTVLSLFLSLVLAVAAVFGVRSYLKEQAALMAAPKPVVKNTLVVAAQPLRFGKLVEPSSLRVIEWPADSIPEGAFRTLEEIMGDGKQSRYVMTAIEQAEPILNSKITGPGQRATLSAALSPGMKAVSIRVNDVLGVAGFVLPGDRVDIMLTRQVDSSAEGMKGGYTDVLLQGVKVLAIDQSADDRADKPEVVKAVTLEVSTSEAQKLTLAATVGMLSLALRNIASADVEQIEPVGLSDLGGGLSSQALALQKIQTEREERISNIERLVRKVGENVDQRVEKLAAEINKPKPVEVRKVEVAPPPPVVDSGPSMAGVGVYRNAERTEYKVRIQDVINGIAVAAQ